MDIIGYILLLVAIAELGLAAWFLFRYTNSQATFWYGLFTLTVAVYVGANGIGYITESVLFGERVAWIGGIGTALFFLPFTYSFPVVKKPSAELLPWILWPAAIFFFGLLATDVFISTDGTTKFGEGYKTNTGPFFLFMISTFVIYWTWSVLNLIRARRVADGLKRWQVTMVMAGIFFSLSVSVTFDVVLPLLTVSTLGFVGSLFTSVWLGMTSYVIVKK